MGESGMGKLLKIIDEECAKLELMTMDNKELSLQWEFVNHIALEIVKLLQRGLTSGNNVSINMSECGSNKKHQLTIKDNYLFVNGIQIKESPIDIAKQIIKDIEGNISDWALYYYGNMHTAEEWEEKDWRKIHIQELRQGLDELKSIIQ